MVNLLHIVAFAETCDIHTVLFPANNLYGSAQTKPLPVKDFHWVSIDKVPKLTDRLTRCDISENSKTGYILEVDLEYPAYLHEDHNSFPLAPERTVIKSDMMSAYAKGNATAKTILFSQS